jgi:hypothetical protein
MSCDFLILVQAENIVCCMYVGLMDIIVKNHLVKLVLADTCLSFEPFQLCMSNSVREMSSSVVQEFFLF